MTEKYNYEIFHACYREIEDVRNDMDSRISELKLEGIEDIKEYQTSRHKNDLSYVIWWPSNK
ncbi:hypothetical protein CL617_05020 [archaeon]|jgi:hypothetical protein|nr:hypothetical protein [archaeon]|tara:strand:- start:273 stop:458 length:186 start_codon:yes stop_codon:yes gene_type:complete